MGRKLDKLLQGLTDHLEPGEEVLAGVKAIPDGEAEAGILGAAGAVSLGAVGLMFGSKLGSGVGEDRRTGNEAAGVVSSKGRQVALVLTDRRVLVFALGLSGKAKDLLGVIPRDEITDIAMGTTKLFGQSMPLVSVITRGGQTAGFGVGKIRKASAVALIEAFQASTG